MSIHRRPAWQRLQQLLVPIGHSHCVQPIRLMAHAGMSILSLFEAYAPSHPGASEAELQAVEAHHGRFLPAALRELLRWSNGFRADMNRTFIDLWSTRELVEWNDASGLPRRLPGLLVVGTDGADSYYALDYRNNAREPALAKMSSIIHEWDEVREVAPTFADGLGRLIDEG